MAEEAKLDQDSWTDNTNYDRVNNLLEKVEATAEEAKRIVSKSTNPTKKIVSRRSGARFNTSRLLGSRSRTSTSPTPHHHDVPTSTTLTCKQSSIIQEAEKIFESNDKEVRNICSEVVTKHSKSTYRSHNITFIFWLYDTIYRDLCLQETFIEEFKNAKDEDTRADEIEKNKKTKRKKKTGLRKNQRKVCHNWLDPLDYENTKNCPIILENLTFEIYSRYISTRKKDSGGYMSKITYGGMQSGLTHLFRCCDTEITENFYADLTTLMQGMKRTVARDKQQKGIKVEDGKSPLSLQMYRLLCDYFLSSEQDEHIFCHAFLTLEWNLMARADNVCNTHINHVEWRHDSLVIFFAHSKGDQEGLNRTQPWHIYSNPLDPTICSVMALGKYLFSNPTILLGNSKLFPGSSQYSRFTKGLQQALITKKYEIEKLGGDITKIGTHSARKGSATLCACGCTVSPPMASICLRAGWSMGTVKDRYLHYEKAGDQYVGRTVAGISALSIEFAASPAFFDFEDIDEKRKLEKVLNDFTGGNLDPNLLHSLIFMYASLIYHRDFLTEKLHPKNALFGCSIFTNVSTLFCQRVVIRFPWNQTRETPVLTGVPPHILILAKLSNMERSQLDLADEIVNKMTKELDERDIGGGYQASVVMKSMADHCDKIMNELKEVKRTRISLEDENSTVKSKKKNGFGVHCFGGKFSLLPKDWVIPNLKFQSFLIMWLLGDKANGIPPLKSLRARDVYHLGKRARKTLNEMKDLARAVSRAGTITGHWKGDNFPWTLESATILFRSTLKYFEFPSRINGHKRRFEHMSWKSIHNLYLRNKKKLVGEVPVDTKKNEKYQTTMFDAP